MDGNMNIWEGYEPSYPAPGSESLTAYPALDLNDATSSHTLFSLPHGDASSANEYEGPSIEDTARGYLTLAEYFQIGREQPPVDQEFEEGDDDFVEDRDGSADEMEVDEEVVEEGEADEGGNGGAENEHEQQQNPQPIEPTQPIESPQPLEPPKPPKTVSATVPDNEDIWTSLPGTHHGLPDEDYLAAQTEDVWPHRLDPAANPPPPARAPYAPVFHGSGVSKPRGRGKPRGRRGWKWALRGTAHEDMFNSPKITAEAAGTKRRGRGGTRNRGGSRGRTRGGSSREPKHIDPGEAFKAFQAKATMAFLENDLEGALDFALQAVTENPEVPAAHFLIDQVLTEQGRHEEALQAHWSAAMASRHSDPWVAHGERLLELAGDDKTERDYDAALRCYSEALKFDKNKVEIRAKKVDLFIDMKAYKHAFRECRAMLKLKPGDTDMLWKLAELLKLAQDGKESRASREERVYRVIDAYRTAFHEWRAEPVFGDADMQWAHLDMYIGLLEDNGAPVHDCIRELKQIARWLLGRGHEIFWDSLPDDREYDLTPDRRIQTDFWRSRMFTLDDARYGNGLPLWLRAKLGCMRARMGYLYRDEALRHLGVLLVQCGAAEDNPETFMLTAERLCALTWYEDAIKFYEAAKDQVHAEAPRFFGGMGRCYKALKRSEDAIKAFRSALDSESDNMDARIELARLYSETGRKLEAAEVALSISRLGRESIQRSEKAMLARNLMKATERPKQRPLLPNTQDKAQMSRSDVVLQHLPAEHSHVESGETGQDTTEAFPSGTNRRDRESDIADESSDDEIESLPASTVQGSPMPRRRAGQKGKIAHKEEVQQLWQQRLRVQRSYDMVKKLWPSIEDRSGQNVEAAQQWMEHAAALATEFSNTKVFYPHEGSSRFAGLLAGKNAKTRQVIAEMEALRKRMRDVSMENLDESEAMPSTDDQTSGDFHDISFQEWHRMMSDLALQYARFAHQAKCKSMITALTRANVFRHDFALYNTTLALSIYCAIVFNDRDLFLEASRQYLYQSDYRSGMAYQIFAATGSFGYGENPFESDSGKMQQWTAKLVKMQDMLVMDPEMRAKWEWKATETNWKEAGHERLAKAGANEALIPGLLTTYAHIVTSKRRVHNTTSLTYLFRALALEPDDVVVNLSLATNCIVDALRRSDPGQKSVQQGLGFFYRYYTARVATGRKCYLQEAEYNAARIWDLLGWPHLAAKGYDKVLKLSPQVREEAEREGEETEDVASEAAFALQKMFIAANNEHAARAIGEEWLVL